jgi:hypothetical protein
LTPTPFYATHTRAQTPPFRPHLTRLLPGARECLPPPVVTDSGALARDDGLVIVVSHSNLIHCFFKAKKIKCIEHQQFDFPVPK